MKMNYLKLLSMALISVGLFMVSFFASAVATDDILRLQTRWAVINYQTAKVDREGQLKTLLKDAEQAVKDNPKSAALLIWEGVIRSTYAGEKGGLGALGEVKKAKKSFEKAIAIDPGTMGGSAYTSLGSLYYQVPGWPIGFGDDKKARKILKKGLKTNPNGIDANYFYGDFLLEQGEYVDALKVLETALNAPARPNRAVADQGRQQEIKKAINKVRKKLGLS